MVTSWEAASERRASDSSLAKSDLEGEKLGIGELHDHDVEHVGDKELPQGRQVGIASAIFLMVNRMLGTGVFSTTSTILQQGGSVGISLIYWVVGGLIAGIGFAVYAEFATALPRNGGELNYVSYVFRKPKYLTASMYAAQALLLGQAAGNANAAGQYFLRAGGVNSDNEWNPKGIGIGILAFTFIMHSCFMKYGLWLQNALGVFKVVILLLIVFAGFAALAGHHKGPNPHNFENAFVGTHNSVYNVSSCIYNAVWSYVGYSNLFYALGEVRNPTRTLKIAGPLAIVSLTILYVLAQVAYFAAVPREEILESNQIIAANFFAHMFGEQSARALSVFVALSAVANVFSVVFSQGRLNQALGRDNLIPFSKMFASNLPFNAPMAGIGWHTLMTLILMIAPPQGSAYTLVLNLSSYPLNVVNFCVGFGLCFTYLPDSSWFKPNWLKGWRPPFRATLAIVILFSLISLFLVVVPWIPPVSRQYDQYRGEIPYYLAPLIGSCFFAGGAGYWLIWYGILPYFGNYRLVPVRNTLSDGTARTTFEKRSRHPTPEEEIEDELAEERARRLVQAHAPEPGE
ncbi:methionine permease [Malassezia furfur]|uniref:Methionine permease n=1 Tax=Malassezia furfur TaxID=55194 RepID=A0ABY8F048_MALFU|nr:MUP1 [Malassezia furfur]WFD49368.1 methionine permease [Malassezia furfur]